jgi:Type ISP C-terminal specificity domain/N-6 DNA Methylase
VAPGLAGPGVHGLGAPGAAIAAPARVSARKRFGNLRACGKVPRTPTMTTPLITYLQEVGATRATGANTPETSFYPAVKQLLDAIGRGLTPKVLCVMNLRNQGAGLPDGGLFTIDQFERQATAHDVEVAFGTLKPSRGAIEVKPPTDDLGVLSRSKQATGYGGAYRHVLLTNLREFALVEYGDGGATVIERFSLATSDREFWSICSSPSSAKKDEEHFVEFLHRVLRTPAPLTEPEDLAWFLASYAREALAAIEHAPIPGLTDVAAHLEAALGVGFGFGVETESPLSSQADRAKAQHFFRSILVQTLFYGVFSAWVLWCQGGPSRDERFSWRETAGRLHLTLLNVLFHEMTRPTQVFTQLLRSRLGLAEATLNRVDRVAFFKRFRQHEAVQYFYEPFLEAFDPELRKEMGVWYTPDEVVQYIVERVDRALREDLGFHAGLADPNVLVLDPCCGTGGFLIAVLDRIRRTLVEQGEDNLVSAQVLEAACNRIYGFEILPAPFVVAHLQVSLYLERVGAQMPANSRVGIYLTNALTGWSPKAGKNVKLWEGLKEERDHADRVKRKSKILVVLGNPPYNAFAGVQPQDEDDSVDVYKEGLGSKWHIRKFNLDDLYVRFLRLAERKIVEQLRRGVVCYISNASYASDKSFVVLREKFLRGFDTITIDNCNGDSRETGKLTPTGTPDPSIFSTPRNREGIRVGTAIGLFVLTGKRRKATAMGVVKWRDFWGESKRKDLLASLDEASSGYSDVVIGADTFWSFKPQNGTGAYRTWPRVVELCEHEPISGLAEKRKGGLFAMDRESLAVRLAHYFDRELTWAQAQPLLGELANDAADYLARRTRAALLKAGEKFSEEAIRRYALLPLDNRWCYWTDTRPLWNRARPDLATQVWPGNRALLSRTAGRRPNEGWPTYATTALSDHHFLDPNVVAMPFRWRSTILGKTTVTANLSERARAYMRQVGIADADANEKVATLIWYHALAVCYSREWLAENGDAIHADFPRVPMPGRRDVLEHSAALGRQVADLLDPDVSVPGVTTGKLRDDLRPLDSLKHRSGRQLDPARGDLAVAARWGALQQGTIVMPGPGRVTDAADVDLRAQMLGPRAFDVWLNQDVCVHAVPEAVWEFTVGGYQVIKKWLSYREKAVLGRDLTLDEARYLSVMVRRIAAVLLLGEELDAAYREARDSHVWTRSPAT